MEQWAAQLFHGQLSIYDCQLVFIDDMTADRDNRMNLEMFCAIWWWAYIQPKESEPSSHGADGRRPEAGYKSNQTDLQGKEVEWYAMAKSVTWHESCQFSNKTEGKVSQEQAGSEDSCSGGPAEHQWRMKMKSSIWSCHWCVLDFRL